MASELRFDGEVALVTGGGSGLGRAYALSLAARGAEVVVNGIDDRVNAVVAEIIAAGGKAVAAPGTVDRDAQAIVEAASQGGRLDIVINNAGVATGGHFAQMSADDVKRTLDVHLNGTIAISRAAWPLLVASGNGRLFNTSSSSTFGAAFTSYYGGAKAAIFALTRAWAAEALAQDEKVRVIGVMPSAYTPMSEQIPDLGMRALLRDHFQPERVASFATWLLHRDTTITGETFQVGGNRAARVVLAEAHGAIGSERAESWAGREADVMSLEGLETPLSMIDEVDFQVRSLGGEVARDFAKVDVSRNWSELD